MKITYAKQYDLNKPAVVKLWFGKKYFVYKFFDLESEVEKFIESLKEVKPTDELFGSLIRHLDTNKVKAVKVEVMIASAKGERLLLTELALLKKAFDDPVSLNQQKGPQRPAWVNTLLSPTHRPRGFFLLIGRHRHTPAVVKLHVGPKYFIWKCKDIAEFEKQINEAFHLKMTTGYKANDPFAGVVRYIIANNITSGSIEVMKKFHPTHVNRIINYERRHLYANISNKNCLNNTRKPYIPEWAKALIK